jgi:Fe-S-cluster containining protein
MKKNSKSECSRCGKCCLADMAAFVAYLNNEDLARWKNEGRDDILHLIENETAIWVGDHLISSKDGRYIHGCSFLKKSGDHYTCSIYETRPIVCRDYATGSSEICPEFKR